MEELFVWPSVRDLQWGGLGDFEDEDLSSWREPEHIEVDLRDFPRPEFDRLVVVGGPGCGKSALLTALATRLATGPFVPVEIPLALLAASGKNVLAFAEAYVKDEFNWPPNLEPLAEQGLLVLPPRRPRRDPQHPTASRAAASRSSPPATSSAHGC